MNEQQAIRKMIRENPKSALQIAELIDAGKIGSSANLALDSPLTMVGAHQPYGIVGSKQFRCECGKAMWLSPSSTELLARRTAPTTLMCTTCMLAHVDTPKSGA